MAGFGWPVGTDGSTRQRGSAASAGEPGGVTTQGAIPGQPGLPVPAE